MSTISVLARIKPSIKIPNIEGWLFLPALRARDVVMLSIGVAVTIIALTVALSIGSFVGYFNAIAGLLLLLVGLTPWLMNSLWEKIKR
jgi:hypothetical protein